MSTLPPPRPGSRPRRLLALLLAPAALLAACGPAPDTGPRASAPPPSAPSAPAPVPSASAAAPATDADASALPVVRFSARGVDVDVVIDGDSAATRAFLDQLPTTLALEEFAGREKIADLPSALPTDGVPGSDPEDGDLIYFVPWGNIGFYYDASGIEYSDLTLHLGRYEATREQLDALEGADVQVAVVE